MLQIKVTGTHLLADNGKSTKVPMMNESQVLLYFHL